MNGCLTTVRCGIPRGTNLGPLLFLIYINDLPNCLSHCQPRMYEDNTLLTSASNNIECIDLYLNQDLTLTEARFINLSHLLECWKDSTDENVKKIDLLSKQVSQVCISDQSATALMKARKTSTHVCLSRILVISRQACLFYTPRVE